LRLRHEAVVEAGADDLTLCRAKLAQAETWRSDGRRIDGARPSGRSADVVDELRACRSANETQSGNNGGRQQHRNEAIAHKRSTPIVHSISPAGLRTARRCDKAETL